MRVCTYVHNKCNTCCHYFYPFNAGELHPHVELDVAQSVVWPPFVDAINLELLCKASVKNEYEIIAFEWTGVGVHKSLWVQQSNITKKNDHVWAQQSDITKKNNHVWVQQSDITKKNDHVWVQQSDIAKKNDHVWVQQSDITKKNDHVWVQRSAITKKNNHVWVQRSDITKRNNHVERRVMLKPWLESHAGIYTCHLAIKDKQASIYIMYKAIEVKGKHCVLVISKYEWVILVTYCPKAKSVFISCITLMISLS